MCNVLSPGLVLLSANGSLAFKSCARYEDVASFTAPEVQQGHAASSRTVAEKVRKLDMTMMSEGFFIVHNIENTQKFLTMKGVCHRGGVFKS